MGTRFDLISAELSNVNSYSTVSDCECQKKIRQFNSTPVL